MPTHRFRFTGLTEEDFPDPPIARRLQPGDVVEYEAPEPVEHARLELVDDALDGWERDEHHAPGLAAVLRAPAVESKPPRNRKAAVDEPASTDKE